MSTSDSSQRRAKTTSASNDGSFAEHGHTAPDVSLAQSPLVRGSYEAAVEKANSAALAYYDSDAELMSDAGYDSLLDEIRSFELANPDVVVAHGLFTEVGAGVSVGGDVSHDVPMLSLDKANTVAEVRAFVAKCELAGGTVVLEPKLDGMAVDAKFVDGVRVRVATRGDGRSGEDVTARVDVIAPDGLPTGVPWPGVVHVRGELVMAVEDFVVSNKNRVGSGKPAFKNPRNAISGSVLGKTVTYAVQMSFVTYGVTGADNEDVSAAGLILSSSLIPAGDGSLVDSIDAFGALRSAGGFRYPTDGVVLKVVEPDVQAAMGETSRAPRWAMAYKYSADRATTVLLGIETAVGRTGAISYTAVVEPVEVDGSIVGRATLHNAQFIADRDLRIGDTVEIFKANDIIPRIEKSFAELRGPDSVPYVPSTVCPVSGEPLDMRSVIWRSPAPEASLGALVAFATARDCLDIDGLGVEISDGLVDSGLVNDLGDLFTLTQQQIASLTLSEGRVVGEKVAAKLVANIEAAKTQPLNRTITALGIRKSGRTFGRRLSAHFGTMENIQAASKSDFFDVEGVGEERAELFYQGFARNTEVIEKLRTAGVNMGGTPASASSSGTSTAGNASAGGNALAGLKVVVTGAMTGPLKALNRTEVQELIEANGGQASGSVSSSTSLLVCAEEGSSKFVKAQQLGIRIVTPEEFAGMLGL
jgi:DNA ligase (NAD+)